MLDGGDAMAQTSVGPEEITPGGNEVALGATERWKVLILRERRSARATSCHNEDPPVGESLFLSAAEATGVRSRLAVQSPHPPRLLMGPRARQQQQPFTGV